jgi:SAM-dependent methyltransferase
VRVGDLQFLPYEDGAFDAVVGFNSFQYAADVSAALREARRVLRAGGSLGITVWGPSEECELAPYLGAVGSVLPPPPPGAPGPFRLSEPGVLRRLVEEAGFEVSVVADAAAAFVYADEPTALRGLLSAGPCVMAIAHAGEDAVRDAVLESIAPCRREDGSYAFDNVWRFAIARRA